LDSFETVIYSTRSTRDRLVLRILQETGCKVSELTQLKVGDIRKRELIITSTNRHIRLSLSLLKELKQYCRRKGKSEPLIPSITGQTLSTRRIEQIVTNCGNKENMKLCPRDIRKQFLRKKLNTTESQNYQRETGLKSTRRKPSLSDGEISRFRFAHERDELTFFLILLTGVTVNELTGLKLNQIKGNHLFIDGRIIAISHRLLRKIRSNVSKPNHYLISGKRQVSARRVQQILQSYSKKARVKVTPRILRNTFAYQQYDKGHTTREIEAMMGIKVNMYTHGLIR